MEQLILRQPPDSFTRRDLYGELITRRCIGSENDDPIEHKCIAVQINEEDGFDPTNRAIYTDWIAFGTREDRGGRQGLYADIMAGEWQTRFDILRIPEFNSLNEDWSIVDYQGRLYDIESVVASTVGGGMLKWNVYCVRRKT